MRRFRQKRRMAKGQKTRKRSLSSQISADKEDEMAGVSCSRGQGYQSPPSNLFCGTVTAFDVAARCLSCRGFRGKQGCLLPSIMRRLPGFTHAKVACYTFWNEAEPSFRVPMRRRYHEDAQGSAATFRPGCPFRVSPGSVSVALWRFEVLELLERVQRRTVLLFVMPATKPGLLQTRL